ADKDDIILAAWFKNGAKTDVLLTDYPDNEQVSPAQTNLSALTPDYDAFLATPGLSLQGFPRRLHMLIAGDRAGSGPIGMYWFDADNGGGALKAYGQQPNPFDLGVPGYDTDPHLVAPRIFFVGFTEVNMWTQGGNLWEYDSGTATQGYGAKTVEAFWPLTA